MGNWNLPLTGDDPRSVFYGHVPTWLLLQKKQISQEYLDQAFIFCCVRNVWDRAASLYHYLEVKRKCGQSFEQYLTGVQNAPQDRHNLGHPHSYWLRGIENCRFLPMEGFIQAGFEGICKAIGIKPRQLQHRNTNENYSVSKKEFYDKNPRTKELVSVIYSEDIERFNQTFPY